MRVREGLREGVCESYSIKGSIRLGSRGMTGWTVDDGDSGRRKHDKEERQVRLQKRPF